MSERMIFYLVLDSACFTVSLSADNIIQQNMDPAQITDSQIPSVTHNVQLMLEGGSNTIKTSQLILFYSQNGNNIFLFVKVK